MPATTKIKVEARKADVPTTMTATMSTAVSSAVTPSMSFIGSAATVRGGAPAIHRMTVAVITCDDLLAIHGAAAGAAAMRETAGTAVAVACLAASRGHHGKTSADSQEGDKLFHEWGMSVFGLAPQSSRHDNQTRRSNGYSDTRKTFWTKPAGPQPMPCI